MTFLTEREGCLHFPGKVVWGLKQNMQSEFSHESCPLMASRRVILFFFHRESQGSEEVDKDGRYFVFRCTEPKRRRDYQSHSPLAAPMHLSFSQPLPSSSQPKRRLVSRPVNDWKHPRTLSSYLQLLEFQLDVCGECWGIGVQTKRKRNHHVQCKGNDGF